MRAATKRRRLGIFGVLALACGTTAEPRGVTPDAAADVAVDVVADADPSTPLVAAPREGSELIGRPASEVVVQGWLQHPWIEARAPIDLAALRGSVVLVRFWTDTCPFCRASAPALVELDRDFRDRGLVVLGVYHPKPRPADDTSIDLVAMADRVARVADEYGFRFPIGLDLRWHTIDTWWLHTGDRNATSASFVIDRQGVVRGVHPGPELHPGGPADHVQCRTDYAELRALIESLL